MTRFHHLLMGSVRLSGHCIRNCERSPGSHHPMAAHAHPSRQQNVEPSRFQASLRGLQSSTDLHVCLLHGIGRSHFIGQYQAQIA